MNAEQVIKAELDGKFFSVNPVNGEIITKAVPIDYIPAHRPLYQCNSALVSVALKDAKANPWLPADDEELVSMRARGLRWGSIRKILRRGEKSIRERYLLLCEERGIEPLVTPVGYVSNLTPAAKAEIISLRKQGCTFSQIGEITGRPVYQIMDYYNRWLASKRQTDEAA